MGLIGLALLAGTLVILALAAWYDGLEGMPLASRRRAPRWASAVVDRERDLAALLGVPFRGWATLRLAVLIGCVWIGASTGVPLLVALAVFIAGIGVPWACGGVVAQRKTDMARELSEALADATGRMERGGLPLDTALREVALNPRPGLQGVLGPIAGAQSVDEALVASVEATRFALAERTYVVLSACRARSTESLVRILRDAEVRSLKREVERLGDMRATRSGHRATIGLIGALELLGLIAAAQLPDVAAFLHTVIGQVFVLIGMAIFAMSATAMIVMSGLREPLRWDVRAAKERLGALRRG